MCDTGVGKMSVSVMTTKTAWQRQRMETVKLYTTCYGMFCHSYYVAEVSVVVDSSSAHADLVHPIDVLLRFNLTNGEAKVMSGRFGAAETHAETFHR